MALKTLITAALLGICLTATAATERPDLEDDCVASLKQADKALADARVDGFGESAAWAEAATLISAAKVQKTFAEYENCHLKAKRAIKVLGQTRG
ncbi:hypothetical protein GYB61_05090 [bacterium]|nr:hypothetical protein [bacterium]